MNFKPLNYRKGFCGIGIYFPNTKENIGTLIRSAVNFGADFVFTIGKRYKHQNSDIGLHLKIPILYFETIEDFYKSMPPIKKYTAIELTEKSRNLKNYCHPKQAIYLLGNEANGIPKEILNSKRFDFVEIEGNSSLNVAVARSIVLYDRLINLRRIK